jgi:menaquinone-9 beta-reductase
VEEVALIGKLPQLCMQQATQTMWDAIVIGGGPAGALAARQAALSGLQTLLVEAKQFPREKVCGGYLNNRALEALRSSRVFGHPFKSTAADVREIEVVCGRQRARFSLPPGQIICRSVFDAQLLDAAAVAGVSILSGIQAVVEPVVDGTCRRVSLSQNHERGTVSARVVVCADGLARSSVRQLPEFGAATALASRVGIGVVVTTPAAAFSRGQIVMVVSRDAYVGIALVDEHRINIAAAIVPSALAHTTPSEVVANILEKSNISVPGEIHNATWRGTPALTSRPHQVAAERVFLIGDAAGYVEPFTGEGMATALESALAITPLVVQAARSWDRSVAVAWADLHRRIVCDRQRIIRQMAWTLHRRWAAVGMLALCRMMPRVATRIIAEINAPSAIESSPEIGVL